MDDPKFIDPPPPVAPTLPYASPPSGPRKSGIGTIIAWIVILLIVGYLVIATVLPEIRGKRHTADDTSDMQLAITTKYLLGVRSFIHEANDQLLSQIDRTARSPVQKLHVAIVAGELLGGEEALNRLDTLDTEAPEFHDDIEALRAIYLRGSDALEPAARDQLLARHEFFARLALIYRTPSDDASRTLLLEGCRRVAIAFFGFFALLLLAGVSGFVLLVLAIVFYFSGTIKPAYVRPVQNAGIYAEMFAVYLFTYAGLSLVLALVLRGQISFAWSWGLCIVVPIAVGWGMLRGLSWREIRQGLGWHAGRGALIEVPMGIVGYLAGLPIVAAGFVVTYALLMLTHIIPSHPIQNAPTDTATSVLVLYSIAVVWAPLIEESMFRGALYHHLRGSLNPIVSALIVGLIFASIHPQGWTFIPVLGAIGFNFCLMREWRGSLIAPMIAHGLNNFAMITLLLFVK